MKLRIRGDSVRLRLTRGEVDRFAAEGFVEQSLDFAKGGQVFTYALRAVPGAEAMFAELNEGVLTVSVPESAARAWADSETVGIESDIGSTPRIVIEKDFACLAARPGEDESDMFPNPGETDCRTPEE